MKQRPDGRRATLNALGEVLEDHRSLAEVRAFDALTDPRERAFARRLSYGVLRWKRALDWLADQLLQRPLRRKERAVRRLLLLGLYQLWKEDTAAHAAVHATAETARSLGKPWAVGLINAVLRNFQRQEAALLDALEQRPERLAHADWMLEAFERDWPGLGVRIAEGNNTPGPLWLRVNRQRNTLEAARMALQQAGFTVAGHPLAPDALALLPAVPVAEIPGFATGDFSVQDPAAQLAVDLLDLHPGQRVLDACAAPGGKTGHLLERVPKLQLTALDRSPERLERVGENLDRLGLDAQLHAADAGDASAWWDHTPFDRILIDAPCTATGVIRRHPEIKWLRSADQVNEAVRQQARLLNALWPLLRADGILVYATCSVLRQENSQQVEAFLDAHREARCLGPDGFGHEAGPGRQLLPGEEDTDGFYYAVLRKSPF
ncbi:MAG: 16S rRNA (cytosine(967)-C(5))-methyltransferase RsmB [Pseudomonadota bacterium]